MSRPLDHHAPALTILAASALALLGGCRAHASGTAKRDHAAALASITEADLMRHIGVLASDDFEGRGPGTKGGRKTVDYLVNQFRELGLAPGNPDGSYVQAVPLTGYSVTSTASFTTARGVSDLAFPDQYVAITKYTDPRVEVANSEIVFVGYGVVAPEYGWDDFKDVDVRGKTIVMLVNDPPIPDPHDPSRLDDSMFKGAAMTYYGRWTYKYEEAARLGAAGLILIHTPESAGYGWSVVRNSWSGEQFEIPNEPGEYHESLEAWVTEAAARRLLGLAGVSLDSLMAEARRPGFRARPLPLHATGSIRSDVERTTSANVVALVPGRDSTLRDQVVVYTSHYDHLGIGAPEDGDAIYNGAKDNASGTSAIIELARAYERLPERPRRSVLLAAVTGEESGLLGSAYLARHPPYGHFVADINMDAINMYGRTSDLVELGGEYSSLGDVFQELTGYLGLDARGDQSPGQGHFFRSDQFSFVKRGVPSLYVEQGVDYVGEPAGTGEKREETYRKERYHQPDDEMLPEYTMGGAAQQTQAAFLLGWVAANAPRPPVWKPGSPFAPASDTTSAGSAAGTAASGDSASGGS